MEDFEAFVAKYPDRLFELIHGEIIQKSTTEWHGILVANIATKKGIYLKSNPIGYAGIVVSHQMPNDRYNERLPDISCRHNTYRQLREKAHFYLDNGARMVWLVYPEKQLVEVYQSDSDIDSDV